MIDDGIATGATTRAALMAVRAQKPEHVILAVPVAPTSTIAELRDEADEIVCLEEHEPFFAIRRLAVGHGSIARMMTEEGYGFIASADGREFYFDRDSLSAGSWEKLTLGTKVRFTERDGDKGSFATAVKPLT